MFDIATDTLQSLSFCKFVIGGILIVICSRLLSVGRRETFLPPGPPTIPLLGNLHQTSRAGVHVLYTQWARKYGGIFSLKHGSHTVIVLTDRTIIKQLLDKRGANYADRPDSYVLNELITGGHHLLPMRYGERWRKLRRVIQQELSKAKCDQKHLLLQHAEAIQMLVDFMRTPKDYKLHPKRFGTSVMTSLVFGVRMPNVSSRFMRDMDRLFFDLVSATVTGALPPVDRVPLFKYMPDFLWNNWRTKALAVAERLHVFYGGIIDYVRFRKKVQGSQDSFLDHVLDQQEQYGVTYKELVFLVGTLLEGGSDTTGATMQVFLEAIFSHPGVQQKAHTQIDSVCDGGRLPTWSDYDQLPYVSQIVKETIRWNAISPTAFPHATTHDDTYDGYKIPARSTIIINVYGLHQDPKRFPDPERFLPERFSNLTASAGHLANAADAETSRDHYGYGAGRRLCPGIHLAERNLFISISTLLWAFEFQTVPESHPIEADEFRGPNDMRCRIVIRSAQRSRTILSELNRVTQQVFSMYETETSLPRLITINKDTKEV